jgi:hypothetical protein
MFRLDGSKRGSYFYVPARLSGAHFGKSVVRAGKETGKVWWMTAIACSLAVLDTVAGRRYDAANLYVVLDRIVKPHI